MEEEYYDEDALVDIGWICPKCDISISPDLDICPLCLEQKRLMQLQTYFLN
jgi:hypothetical protein